MDGSKSYSWSKMCHSEKVDQVKKVDTVGSKRVKLVQGIPQSTSMLAIEEFTAEKTKQKGSSFVIKPSPGSRASHLVRFEAQSMIQEMIVV